MVQLLQRRPDRLEYLQVNTVIGAADGADGMELLVRLLPVGCLVVHLQVSLLDLPAIALPLGARR